MQQDVYLLLLLSSRLGRNSRCHHWKIPIDPSSEHIEISHNCIMQNALGDFSSKDGCIAAANIAIVLTWERCIHNMIYMSGMLSPIKKALFIQSDTVYSRHLRNHIRKANFEPGEHSFVLNV